MSYDEDIQRIEAHIARLRDRKKRLGQRKEQRRRNYVFAWGLLVEQAISHDLRLAEIIFLDFAKRPGIAGNEDLIARIQMGMDEVELAFLDDSLADTLAAAQDEVEAQAEALLLARAGAEADAMAQAMASGETLQ